MQKELHVVPNSKGGWDVVRAGAQRALRHFATQAEAIAWATQLAKKEEGELFIHGQDGRIRARNSYGHDPFPPRG